MRLGIPKYQQTWSLLYCLAFTALLASRSLAPRHNSLINIGMLLLSAGMIVSLIGSVRERKKHEAAHKKGTASNKSVDTYFRKSNTTS